MTCAVSVKQRDGISHMFWQCDVVQLFWTQLVNILKERCEHAVNIRMTESLAVLGIDECIYIDNIFYFIMLLAKEYIYHCKLNNKILSPLGFINKLKYRYCIEEYIARKNMVYNDFLARWAPYTSAFM